MFRFFCTFVTVAFASAFTSRSQAAAPIALGTSETIVFLGDSITQQNLYTAYIETFLISRFPNKQLVFWNAGIGGNKVSDALARFDRDVTPLKPTIVIVNFGMNDGQYVPPDAQIREAFAQGMRQLVAKIVAIGARPILCTPPAANKHHALYLEPYNETLAGLAQAVEQVGGELRVPVIDLFRPFRPYAEQAAADPVLIPDGVHPNEGGHLLLASAALGRFGAPGPLGKVVINGRSVTGNNRVAILSVAARPRQLSFQMKLAHHPLHIPASAQKAAHMAGLDKTLNDFSLQIKDWPGTKTLRLLANGQEIAIVANHNRDDIDLAAVAAAPWNKASEALWREAQHRNERQSNSWRALGIDASTFSGSLDSTIMAREALHLWAKDAGIALRTLVAPTTFQMQLEETDEVFVEFLELSPKYPFDLSAADFATRHPPETTPDAVAWQRERVVDRAVDLEQALGHPKKSVVYARLVLQAETPGEIELQLGSNDGLSVFVNGTRVLSRNVSRGLKLGDDSLVAKLTKGQNVLMFRVTQHELRHGLALKIRALGNLVVKQASPERSTAGAPAKGARPKPKQP